MSAPSGTGYEALPPSLADQVDEACDRFEAACKAGRRPAIEEHLGEVPEACRTVLLRELILLEVVYRHRAGETPRSEDYCPRFPALDGTWLAGEIEARTAVRLGRPPPQPGTAGAGGVTVPGYEILGVLGKGGMGVVYRARQLSLGRLVALKMLLDSAPGADDLARFQREVEAVARLQHPNIVPVYEPGNAGGRPFFSMEFVGGGSLAQRLAGTPQPAHQAALWVQALAQAIHHAHQRGIVHRDLKPANILLASGGVVSGESSSATTDRSPLTTHQLKITDFGLAKMLDDAGQTQSGAILGTPSYMAPEQTGGQNKKVGPACDVYALGAILYELLTGRPPFKGATVLDTLEQVVKDDPVAPGELQSKTPRDLETICLKCLQKEPANRYASAEALADDLNRFLAGEPVRARPVGRRERVAKWVRRRPAAAGLVAASGLLLVLLVGGLVAGVLVLAHQNSQAQKIVALEREKTKARDRDHYFTRNTRAFGKWLNRDVGRADQLLDECPEHLRQWEWNYLKRLCHGERFSLRGQGGPAAALAFGPGEKYLAWAGPDLTVRVTDVASRREAFAPLRGHTGAIGSLAFSPGGKRLVSASHDGTVRLWNLESGTAARHFEGRHGRVHSVAFGSRGRRIASGGEDGKVRVWEVAGGRPTRPLELEAGGRPVLGVAFSPDGKWLASGGEDGQVRVWEAQTFRIRQIARSPGGGPVRGVAFSPDASRLAAGCADGRGWLLDPRTGKTVFPLPGHSGAVTGVAFGRESPYLASGSKDGTVILWKATTGARVRTYRCQTGAVTAVALSPAGNYLASAGEDGTVKIWDGTRDPLYRTLHHQGAVLRVAFSPDGRYLASANFEQVVKVWDRRADHQAAPVWQREGLGTCVAFSPDSKLLAVGGPGGKVALCEPATGAAAGACQAHDPRHQVLTLAFGRAPAGLLLACGAGHGGVKVWRLSRTGEGPRPEYKASKVWEALPAGARPPFPLPRAGWGQVLSVAFGPGGQSLAAADLGGAVEVFEAATGKLRFSLQEPGREIQCVAFSPDGDYLAAAVWYDCVVKVWDLKRRTEPYTLSGHTGRVTSVAFSGTAERLRLASGGEDGAVKVWDLETERAVLTLRGHLKDVRGLAFSPDGWQLASAGYDGTVLVWDATPLPAAGSSVVSRQSSVVKKGSSSGLSLRLTTDD